MYGNPSVWEALHTAACIQQSDSSRNRTRPWLGRPIWRAILLASLDRLEKILKRWLGYSWQNLLNFMWNNSWRDAFSSVLRHGLHGPSYFWQKGSPKRRHWDCPHLYTSRLSWKEEEGRPWHRGITDRQAVHGLVWWFALFRGWSGQNAYKDEKQRGDRHWRLAEEQQGSDTGQQATYVLPAAPSAAPERRSCEMQIYPK